MPCEAKLTWCKGMPLVSNGDRQALSMPCSSLPSCPCSLPWPAYGVRDGMACSYGRPPLPRPIRLGVLVAMVKTICTERGQSSVEAAVLLPSVMLVLALLLQPACLLYTRAIMREAAGECLRVSATAREGDLWSCRAFALRRLKAVPEISLFHVGGESDWEVGIERGDGRVRVTIEGHARPLPLMGAVAGLLSMSDGAGVVLRVAVEQGTRPSWVRGDYDAWQDMWQ